MSEEVKEKKGFFARLKQGLNKTRDALNEKVDSVLKVFKKIDEELYEELEEALITADVGVETSMYIIEELRGRVKEKHLTEAEQVKGEIAEVMAQILTDCDNKIITETTPSVILVIGVNGVGKTTSIGKMAAKYITEGKKVILGAADTFRAAAIDQLKIWAERTGADIVCHDEGSDPASPSQGMPILQSLTPPADCITRKTLWTNFPKFHGLWRENSPAVPRKFCSFSMPPRVRTP